MSDYKLEAKIRTEKGEKIRDKSNLPAVVYGAGQENYNLVLDYKVFGKLYDLAGSSSLIDLLLDGKSIGQVLIHDLQYDPISNRVSHVDLKRINMNKEMEATVELEFIGEAPAVKEHGGTLVKNIEEVDVRCLPKDLPSEIVVGLSVLQTFDDVIRIKHLNLPTGVRIINRGENDVVAKAVPALTEEQLKAMEATNVDVSKIEVAGKKPVEGETVEPVAGAVVTGKDAAKKDVVKQEGKKEEKKKEAKK